MHSIYVPNEIGKLKKVLLHRPGEELLNMTPSTLGDLLFDDIPFLERAQEEHDGFANVLKNEGVEVLYIESLIADILKAKPEAREKFIEQVLEDSQISCKYKEEAVREYLNAIEDSKKLVDKVIAGVRCSELDLKQSDFIKSYNGKGFEMALLPMPNLYFTRDPFAHAGTGVIINRMRNLVRQRETVFADILFNYSDEYKDVDKLYSRYDEFSIEGGDVLNLNETTLAVGISQRTDPEAIEKLAQNIFYNSSSKIEKILAIDIPKIRAFMHLDTVFTQIDYDKFTVHPGILKTLRVFELTKGKGNGDIKSVEMYDNLEHILSKYLDRDVELIYCGGGDKLVSEREQWNDGSNTLCIAPGTVVVYERNTVTNKILRDKGIKVLEIRDSELSRGRGGPRCMSMPFVREDI
ncbi:arginine deiminase [Lagierella sp.]|uniref:arginine deiminase n=1 Tax=Lagierella sp. TaxID=2849657 RepID=UPI0026274CB4|nr:arginine deiminase [Lagierella sp.]